MQAVKFPHVNRVAFSSKHNGLALLYGRLEGANSQNWPGKTMEAIDRLGFGSIPPDETEEAVCRRALDNDTSIFHHFQDMGYVVSSDDGL